MKLFGRTADSEYPRSDAGTGNLSQYAYDLVPRNKRVTIELAGSDQFQEELTRLAASSPIEAFISRRTIEEERTDAPMPVRIFADSRMSGIVGFVPRGLEPAVAEALARLEARAKSPRIPCTITKGRRGLRLELRMGETR